jgi:hypothetical protein
MLYQVVDVKEFREFLTERELNHIVIHLAANGLDVIGESIVCSDNRSLPKALTCDFKWDCLEGNDEFNCGK